MKRHGHGVFVVTRGFHFRNMHMHCVQNIFDADLISSDIGGNNVMGIDDVTDERGSNEFCGSVISFQYAFVACALFMHTVCYAPKCQL